MLSNNEIVSSGKWKSQEVFTARLAPSMKSDALSLLWWYVTGIFFFIIYRKKKLWNYLEIWILQNIPLRGVKGETPPPPLDDQKLDMYGLRSVQL